MDIESDILTPDILKEMNLGNLHYPLSEDDIFKMKAMSKKGLQEQLDEEMQLPPSAIGFETMKDGSLQYSFKRAGCDWIEKNRISVDELKKLGLDQLTYPLTQAEVDNRLKPLKLEVLSLLNQRQEIFSNDTCSIADYFRYLSRDQQVALLERGLDLNLLHVENGVAPFTWLIGNAENERAYDWLDLADKHQRPEQRSKWINKPDNMQRYDEITGNVSTVGQTPLQLAIAKGYTTVNGSGHSVSIPNLMLAEKLLHLGANDRIDYAEPTKGNTALHIACARHDFPAIKLLIRFGASRDVKNAEGKTPLDMLSLTFTDAQKLLAFHTSPDGHSNTFVLNQEQFLNQENLSKIKGLVSKPKNSKADVAEATDFRQEMDALRHSSRVEQAPPLADSTKASGGSKISLGESRVTIGNTQHFIPPCTVKDETFENGQTGISITITPQEGPNQIYNFTGFSLRGRLEVRAMYDVICMTPESGGTSVELLKFDREGNVSEANKTYLLQTTAVTPTP